MALTLISNPKVCILFIVLQSEGYVDIMIIKDYSPLGAASHQGHEAVVRLLLEYKADPNRPNEHGFPLQTASWNGHEAVVRLLLEHGADPDQQSKGVHSVH